MQKLTWHVNKTEEHNYFNNDGDDHKSIGEETMFKHRDTQSPSAEYVEYLNFCKFAM